MVEDANSFPTLADLRITTISLLVFDRFLRCDEAMYIRAYDMEIAQNGVRLSLPRSKTYPFRQGSKVLIARTDTSTSPVAMLERYLTVADMQLNSNALVFKGIIKTKKV